MHAHDALQREGVMCESKGTRAAYPCKPCGSFARAEACRLIAMFYVPACVSHVFRAVF